MQSKASRPSEISREISSEMTPSLSMKNFSPGMMSVTIFMAARSLSVLLEEVSLGFAGVAFFGSLPRREDSRLILSLLMRTRNLITRGMLVTALGDVSGGGKERGKRSLRGWE